MSVHQYTSGGRTRNVVNIADPGGTAAAYSLTAANSVPSSATHGFKNFHSQKTLHVLVHNNGLESDDGSPSNMAVLADKIAFWGYNSSLGGKWAPLRIPIRDNANVKLEFPAVTIPDQIAHDGLYRFTVPVEGIERIAVVLGGTPFTGGSGTRGAGSLDIYLGVNTI